MTRFPCSTDGNRKVFKVHLLQQLGNFLALCKLLVRPKWWDVVQGRERVVAML